MSNVIAVIWDFDKTLISTYLQEPIFERFGADGETFWNEVNALPERYAREQGIRVNPDTIYLNHLLRRAKDGTFPGLSNAMLQELGGRLRFYPGIPDIFRRTEDAVASDPRCRQLGIIVEHYVVSTGLAAMIRGSMAMPYMKNIWGCELIEEPGPDGTPAVSEIGYTIDNTTKTRAIFEINKGIPFVEGITVNSSMPESSRRVHFRNMIYIADGPSDIPAFSLVHRNGGSTFAVYPRGSFPAMRQVERLRADGRVDMYAEADYTEGTTASMWITNKVRSLADAIIAEELAGIRGSAGDAPTHLH
ncbi:MAG: haloacid dehalogenase-like hydrolase [Mailhella sp.]|nr:haloacid dehalogenase-like hydrolase [Mailhella sp.]